MRGLLIILVVTVLMVLGGWLVINVGSNSSTVEIRTDKINEDTAEVVDKAKEAIDNASREIEKKTDL